MKTFFFARSDSIFISGILSTFTRRVASVVFERAAFLAYPLFVENAPSTTLDSCMSEATHIAHLVASVVDNVEPTAQKHFLCFYLEAVNSLLKKIVSDRAVVKMDFAILSYNQLPHKTLMQPAGNFYAKSERVVHF